jgi:hypothetical protein
MPAVARIGLGAVTVLLLVSQAGALVLPALVPLHLWAARSSPSPAGRSGWCLAVALTAATVSWALVYVGMGERQPLIWLGPLVAALAGFGAAFRWSGR